MPLLHKNINAQIKRAKGQEQGQAIIIIVFAIIGFIGMTALAVDGGRAYLEKRNSQNVADQIALGGALARIKGAQSQWVDTAYAIGEANGYNNDGKTNILSMNSPPISGQYVGDIEYIQVKITSFVPAYFGTVIGIKQITVTSEAISRSRTSELIQILNGSAVISLAPNSDCQDNRSFWIAGESTLSITGGGIFINSNNPDCALIQNGSGSLRLEDGRIKVVGGVDIQKPDLVSSPFPIVTNTSSISYPPPFMMPGVGCHKEAEILPDGITMSPGAWEDNKSFPPPGIQYLDPGVYCINNTDFIAKGNERLEGNGVTFKIEGGKVQFGGESEVDLRAPNTGDLAGLLIYMPMDHHELIILNGNSRSKISGTILAPGAEIRLNGNASSYGLHSQIIGYTIRSNGTDNIIIVYKDEENLNAYSMPQVQLIK